MESSLSTSRDYDRTSLEYHLRWERLVSTTNWEKGRIISEWREALLAADAPATDYSDEAWSRQVGHVSAQHVGRLRRVFQRFAATQGEYPGLYWSHFQAALDWNDAELWLEGALQNGWSISQMRKERWQAHGAPDELKPRDEDIIVAEWDEDARSRSEDGEPTDDLTANQHGEGTGGSGPLADWEASPEAVRAPHDEGDEPDSDETEAQARGAQPPQSGVSRETAVAAPAPLARLPELPDDLAEAFESFKLAILRYKLDGWREVARDDVLVSLDVLRELALAPAE